MNMFHLCAVSLVVLLSLTWPNTEAMDRVVSVQLPGNSSGIEADEGNSGLCLPVNRVFRRVDAEQML